MTDKFESIRPFNHKEAIVVRKEVFADKDFKKFLEYLNMGITIDSLEQECTEFATQYDFQYAVTRKVLQFFSDHSTTHVEYKGLENISTDTPHLFIANHRDIIMDSAYLQLYFFYNQLNTSRIAIGDNLVSTPLLLNVALLNKMFLVKRSASIREKLVNSKLLSEYIHHSLATDHESVWIAQRNGRTKDGIDKTQQGLIKMLAYYNDEVDVVDALKKLRITPLTISYEYEPCDNLKARELALSEKEKYVKKEGEDFNSICTGIFCFKGRVKIVIGKPIIDELDTIPANLRKNEKINRVCDMIDQQIYQNFQLFPNHYIAYDFLENSDEFVEHYTPEQKKIFLEYIDKQSIVEDVPADKMKNYLLQIYANPVKTHFGKFLIKKEEKDW